MHFVVVSRFPPPIGGVTVFAQRKVAELKRKGNVVGIIDFNKSTWVLKLIRMAVTRREARFLVNTLNPFVLLLFWMVGLLNRCAVYDHNASRHYLNSIKKKWLLVFFSKRAGQMIVVHERLRRFYNENNILTQVESPFLPPDIVRERELFGDYPESLREFIHSSQHQIILNSAWRFVENSNGSDLYGIGCTLELLSRLVEAGRFVRLVFAFGEFNRESIPNKMLEEIYTLEREGVLYLLDGQRELWPLFRHVDLFLRTTSTDGESVSVLEALFFDCPVVASDVVPRPAGVTTYEYGNIAALVDVVSKRLAIY